MNCPHCGGDERACPPSDPCLGRLTEIAYRITVLCARLARCDHKRSALAMGGALLWCKDCGALRSRESSARWELTQRAWQSIDLDNDMKLAGKGIELPPEDSDGKNVIPIKTQS